VGVDHIWVLNPSKQRAQAGSGAPPPSWKTAIYAMIQAKMLEKGLVSNDDAFSFFDVDDDMGITRDEFDMAVRMLDLTGESTPGLIESEISTLYDDCDKDGNGLVDFGEFIRKLDVESMDRAYRAIRTSQDIALS
jgi:Ca2+-binding EF-hand superfamily protein